MPSLNESLDHIQKKQVGNWPGFSPCCCSGGPSCQSESFEILNLGPFLAQAARQISHMVHHHHGSITHAPDRAR